MVGIHHRERHPVVQSVTTAPESLAEEQAARIRRYLVTMGVRTACFLLAALTATRGAPWWVWGSFSVLAVAAISAGVFRFVPDLRVSARAACWGGVLTSLLFNAGNLLVGLYLGRASVSAAYGAAGSAVVLLLWLQFSAYMFLLGAEFTQRLHDRFSAEPRVVAAPSASERAVAGSESAVAAPADSRALTAISRLSGSSSTTRIRVPCRFGGAAEAATSTRGIAP